MECFTSLWNGVFPCRMISFYVIALGKFLGDGDHLCSPIISQRIDLDGMRACGIYESLGVAIGKLFLDEYRLDLVLLGSIDERLKLCDARLPSFLLDGELLESMVLGEVGEGRMVDDEWESCFLLLGELLPCFLRLSEIRSHLLFHL